MPDIRVSLEYVVDFQQTGLALREITDDELIEDFLEQLYEAFQDGSLASYVKIQRDFKVHEGA